MSKKQKNVTKFYKNKKFTKNGQISPLPLIEMDSDNNSREKLKKLEDLKSWTSLVNHAKTASKWLALSSRRRDTFQKSKNSLKNTQHEVAPNQFYENLNSTLNGICSECDSESEEEEEEKVYNSPRKKKKSIRNIAKSSNKTLLIYFAKLARSQNEGDELDLDFIESLVNNGANINTTDRFGQTVFHEVARTWHPDVALFLLALRADINQADKYGRTPLHVAAAVNYPDMVKLLISNGADPNFCTYGEKQTAVHFAAKNDAVDSLRVLIKLGCDKEVRDAKERTPLHTASELDRSETALFLVEEGAQVGVIDSSGQSALTLMIEKMPPVASRALDSFHRTDRPNRKQYFYLHLLEPSLPGQMNIMAKTSMQAIIQHKQMNLLLHPVLQRLVKVKWKQFARIGHFKQVLLVSVFVLLWSVFGLTTPYNSCSEYSKPFKDIWWRVTLEGSAVLMTLYLIIVEIYEWRFSVKHHRRWQEWRSSELEKDLIYCHPRWPEESKYIKCELSTIKNSHIMYFDDFWNIVDWITYGWIVIGVCLRIVALNGNKNADLYHRRFLSISMVIIWARTLKLMRAFQLLGPFIVMLGNILVDTFKFLILFLNFLIPFVFAFWIMFGGSEHAAALAKQNVSATGWTTVSELIYSVFMVTVVGDINFDALLALDKPMARILVSTCCGICGILLLNLFIALMSDTFQRVYDNAHANALMEKAIAIDMRQSVLGRKSLDRFRFYIHGKCAPEEVYYDDDDNEDEGQLEKMTIQIKEVVDNIEQTIEEKLLTKNNSEQNNQSNPSKQLVEKFENFIEKQKYDMKDINDKIDRLTGLVKYLIDEKNEDNGSERNNEIAVPVEEARLRTLPSIYELQPKVFTRYESRHESST